MIIEITLEELKELLNIPNNENKKNFVIAKNNSDYYNFFSIEVGGSYRLTKDLGTSFKKAIDKNDIDLVKYLINESIYQKGTINNYLSRQTFINELESIKDCQFIKISV